MGNAKGKKLTTWNILLLATIVVIAFVALVGNFRFSRRRTLKFKLPSTLRQFFAARQHTEV